IARPGMIMCIGLNYSEHAAESNMEIPEEPIIFGKASNTLNGPYDNVAIPLGAEKTDYEVELGVVLKKDVYGLKDEQEAKDAIAGYCIVNDLSERTFQLERGGQWIKGKSCPGFSPVGPFLATPDELGDLDNLKMTLTVNGGIRQNGNTSFMVFRPAFLVYYLSQFMLLEAGDLISTGTPSGVALGMDPPLYLKKGDLVELSIDGLGTQKQHMI
ncbi:MAG: fumarylacetoacetate hydrolase family protein, partial [Eudoraea sp.]|uniref:fumarylacetoacetate hydrolase family protein n=1 Tax=Eudoraea sp. TaxID=1979955 RepID=UPI003C7273D6